MVRAGLSTRGAIDRGPRPYATAVPPASVVAASALAILPIVAQLGWYPDFGFIMLIAWRLLRSDVWPAWWAAPLGFANDLLTGARSVCRSRCGPRRCWSSTSSTGARCGAIIGSNGRSRSC